MEEANDTGAEAQVDSTEQEEQQVDSTDWKAKAIEFETKYKSENGTRRRLEKDLKQYTSKTTETQNQEQPAQDKGFDYAQKAYLKASGINADEFDFVKEVMDATGKSDIDAVLGSKYFQAELKERRDVKTSEAATPNGSKRAGNSASNTVDYWLSKGELPKDNPELARKVVNARISKEKNKAMFSSQSVVRG